MAVVKVKSHYQVTLPPQIRAKAGVEVGDLFEAKVQGRTINLVPKRLIDRELALVLNEVKRGRVKGPFPTAAERHDRVLHAPFSYAISTDTSRASIVILSIYCQE